MMHFEFSRFMVSELRSISWNVPFKIDKLTMIQRCYRPEVCLSFASLQESDVVAGAPDLSLLW